MFEKLKADIFFHIMLKRPNIDKAYAMVGPEDSWYHTITTVHNALAEIRQRPHDNWDIVSHDGLTMKAVYYPGSSDKTMIWVHGYTSHAERESAYPALFYLSMGYNVLIPYLRAHGPSEGKYISFGPLEARDMLAWVDRVNKIHPSGQIVFHGLSMGGGIVLDLAVQEIPNVKCLISDAPVRDVVGALGMFCGNIFPKNSERIAGCFFDRFRKCFNVDPADYDRVANLTRCRYPLLLSAGSTENCEELFASLQQNNPRETTTVILPGCAHGNGMYKQTELYQHAIREFLNKHMMEN